MKCDCIERVGVDIVTYKMFEELKAFFDQQVKNGVFEDVIVKKPFYIGKDGYGGILEWYADKWYVCKVCGCLWEFRYPDFPTIGRIRKFEDGIYPAPKTNF